MPFGKGSLHPQWKGGSIVEEGYVYIFKPEHPRATRHGKYVKRADLLLETKLGRPLQVGEIAHHLNGIRDDDSPDNLELRTKSSHGKDPQSHLYGPNHPAWKAAGICPRCGGKRGRGHQLCRKCYIETGEASRQVKRGWKTRKEV